MSLKTNFLSKVFVLDTSFKAPVWNFLFVLILMPPVDKVVPFISWLILSCAVNPDRKSHLSQ